ncbi:MAG: lysophospholipid acyltransferase family protein [Actinomycetota bacterium]
MEGFEHIPPTGPLLVAANHTGYIDSLVCANMLVKAGRRPRYLGKAEMFEEPILGWALRAIRQIPVHRGTGSKAPLEDAVAALHRGETVVMYPEGTVTRRSDGLPQRAKMGLAWLALASGVPVTPIAGWGTQEIWQKSGKGSLKLGRPLWLRAGPAMDFSAYAEKLDDVPTLRKVTDEIMDTLTDMTVDLKAHYPKRWHPENVTQ